MVGNVKRSSESQKTSLSDLRLQFYHHRHCYFVRGYVGRRGGDLVLAGREGEAEGGIVEDIISLTHISPNIPAIKLYLY